MRCSNCYREIPEDALYCPYCGEERPGEGKPSHTETSAGPQMEQAQTEKRGCEPGPENVGAEEPFQAEQPFRAEQPEAREVHGIPYTYGDRGLGNESGSEGNGYSVPEKTVNWVPYLVLAIISTICCCPPFGIVAIVYAVKINSEISDGYSDKAADSARKAKIWIIVAVAAGVVWDLIMLFFGLVSAMNGYYFY